MLKRTKNIKAKIIGRFMATTALLALIVGSSGASAALAEAPQATVKVTIQKYIDGEKATAESASSTSFSMTSTWNAENIGPGTGQYALSPSGFNSANSYEAVTADMTSGADYTTNENLDNYTGSVCNGTTTPYSLAGYSYGNSLGEAEGATKSLTPPALTNITNDKYIIVWNNDCSNATSTPPGDDDNGTSTSTVKVTIKKYIDGHQATSESASSSSFTMNAHWTSTSHGSGNGQYVLGPVGSNSTSPYTAETVNFNSGADYSTDEVTMWGDTTGPNCEAGKPFALVGYSSGNSLSEAENMTPSTTAPSFTNLTSDKSVIVWNHLCSNTGTSTDGTIGGDVTDASSTLKVISVTTERGSATADGSFESGWRYVFHITAPTNEEHLAMKFSNWTMNNSSSTIPVANNMRISSAQSDTATSTVLLTAANTYSTPAFNMTGDLEPGTPGRQVDVVVEVAIPVGTEVGSYTTNYGVKTSHYFPAQWDPKLGIHVT